MTVTTLRPAATDTAGSFSAVPSGTLHGVTSDDSDSTYALGSGTLNDPMVVSLDALVLGAEQRVRTFQMRTRWSSSSDDFAAGGQVQAAGGVMTVTQPLTADAFTTPADELTGWRSPSAEVTNTNLAATRVRVSQTSVTAGAGLRVYELYVDLDVRDRPVVDDLSVSVNLGEPTYNVEFSYNTSGLLETVTVKVTVVDEQGTTFVRTEQVTGTDFSNFAVAVPHGANLATGNYTITATVSAGGFVAPNITFVSAPVSIDFGVFPAGVDPPELTCTTDQEAQQVVLEIEQPGTSGEVPDSCLNVEGSSGAVLADTVNVISGTTVSGEPIRHIALWVANQLVACQIEVDGADYELTLDTTAMDLPGLSVYRLVIVTEGAPGTGSAVIISQQVNGPVTITHNLNTVDLVVQAFNAGTGEQAVTGAELVAGDSLNSVAIPGPFNELTTVVLIAYDAAALGCIGTQELTVPPGGSTFARPFSTARTVVTTVTAGNLVAWADVVLTPGFITIGNITASDLTVWVSGTLATFDDPSAVRAEVQRDRQLIPLDGLNGALVPTPGDGPLVVVDRFPVRFAADVVCDGNDADPVGPTYRVRFYGAVDGAPAYSPWAECTPPPLYTNGRALIRHPVDPELDVDNCVSAEDFQRVRPFNSAQPLDGGLPFNRTGEPSGRNFTVTFETEDTAQMQVLDELLAAPYVWYAPLDAHLPGLWVSVAGTTSFSGYKNSRRPWMVGQSLIETEPPPVVLPPMGA